MYIHKVSIYINLLFILFTLTFNTYAQDIRIPYRIGNKFGLSDENGQLTVEAKYDKINFIDSQFQYFQYTNIIKDSVRNVYGGWSENNKKNTGVYYKDKIIIENTPFGHFRLFKTYFITGSMYNHQRPEDFMLYNLKGEPLLSEIASHIYINDRRDIGSLNIIDSNLVFVSIFHKGKRRKRKFSLGVYNFKTQKIENWLVKRVTDFKLKQDLIDKKSIFIQYIDNKGYQSKYLYYDKSIGNFKLSERIGTSTVKTNTNLNNTTQSKFNQYSQYYNDLKEIETIENSRPVKNRNKTIDRKKFTWKNNELFFGEIKVTEMKGAEYLKLGRTQSLPVIYKLNGKYGFVKDVTSRTEAKYDSLFYMNGTNALDKKSNFIFLVGKLNKLTNSWKYGVINSNEKNLIPVIYDQIIPHIPTLTWDFYLKHFDKPLHYYIAPIKGRTYSKRRPKFYTVRDFGLVGLKKGKIGIMNLDNEIIFPFELDGIYHNDMSYTNPIRSYGKYYILSKNGKYGIFRELMTSKKQLKRKIVFPYIPASYYPNYGGKKGFNLVNLVNKDGTFCYAKEDGYLYYRKK